MNKKELSSDYTNRNSVEKMATESKSIKKKVHSLGILLLVLTIVGVLLEPEPTYMGLGLMLLQLVVVIITFIIWVYISLKLSACHKAARYQVITKLTEEYDVVTDKNGNEYKKTKLSTVVIYYNTKQSKVLIKNLEGGQL